VCVWGLCCISFPFVWFFIWVKTTSLRAPRPGHICAYCKWNSLLLIVIAPGTWKTIEQGCGMKKGDKMEGKIGGKRPHRTSRTQSSAHRTRSNWELLIVAYYSRPQSSKGHPDSDSEFVLSSAIIKNKKKRRNFRCILQGIMLVLFNPRVVGLFGLKPMFKISLRSLQQRLCLTFPIGWFSFGNLFHIQFSIKWNVYINSFAIREVCFLACCIIFYRPDDIYLRPYATCFIFD